jgi:hypothetical protein
VSGSFTPRPLYSQSPPPPRAQCTDRWIDLSADLAAVEKRYISYPCPYDSSFLSHPDGREPLYRLKHLRSHTRHSLLLLLVTSIDRSWSAKVVPTLSNRGVPRGQRNGGIFRLRPKGHRACFLFYYYYCVHVK